MAFGHAGGMIETSEPGQTVVVGVDGSEGSRVALEWALDKQHRLGQVRTVTAYQVGPFGDGFGSFADIEPGIEVYQEAAEVQLRAVLETTDINLLETAAIFQSPAGPALVQACADASLLVVGNRGRSGLAEKLLGSVGSHCIKHSKVPVAVVPPDTPIQEPINRIAVGVDGSSNSRAALSWAIDHVEPDGTVIVVGCYDPTSYVMEGYIPALEVLEKQVQSSLEESVAEVVGNSEVGPTIEMEVRANGPRTALREVGESADLLVIGARGHRGVAYLMLGSVATSLLYHPTSATVVVPF
jgi:nucleotide-binding universal stress UspA family protein